MKSVVLAVIVVLSMLAVHISHRQAAGNLTCDQLPKLQFLSFDVLVAESPFVYDYSLTPLFDCSTKVFTYPARGVTNYSGTALDVRGSGVTAFDISVDDDNKTLHAVRCSTGEPSTWYSLAAQLDDTGAFYCVYTCAGQLLREFKCGSNNNGTSKAEAEAVNMAKNVTNGYLIHDAKQNCSAHIGCNVF